MDVLATALVDALDVEMHVLMAVVLVVQVDAMDPVQAHVRADARAVVPAVQMDVLDVLQHVQMIAKIGVLMEIGEVNGKYK